MTAPNSPTPYRCELRGIDNFTHQEYWLVYDGNGTIVSSDVDEATAAFIVTAVNSQAALVEALRGTLDAIELMARNQCDADSEVSVRQAIRNAFAALAAAEGKQ